MLTTQPIRFYIILYVLVRIGQTSRNIVHKIIYHFELIVEMIGLKHLEM